MKKFLAGFMSCALLFGIVYLSVPPVPKKELTPSENSEIKTSHELLKKLAVLEQQNLQLKQRLEHYHHNHPAITPQAKSASSASTSKAHDQAMFSQDYENYMANVKRAADFSQYTAHLQDANKSMLEDIGQKFSAEQIDYNWAPDYQQKIARMFTEAETLAGISPHDIECRTNKCQIRIPVTNNEEANKLTQVFAEAVQTNNHDVAKTEVIATQDLPHGVLNLYIAKNNTLKAYE